MPLLVDTGILYALADRRDAWHRRVRDFLRARPETLLVPVTVLPEVAYLLRDRIGVSAEQAFVDAIVGGELAVENLTARDIARAREAMASYEFLGLVDATVVAMAERLRLKTIATTDRRHFSAVRPVHAEAFALVP